MNRFCYRLEATESRLKIFLGELKKKIIKEAAAIAKPAAFTFEHQLKKSQEM